MRVSAVLIGTLICAAGCSGTSEQVDKPDKPKKAPPDAGPAMMGEEEELGEKREVQFSTEDGVVIRGLFRPGPKRQEGSEDEKGDHVVLLVHQLGSSEKEWVGYLPSLLEQYSVLTIDLRGHGDSLYRTDATSIDREKFNDADWARTVLDVRAAVLYIKDLQPPPTGITLVGSSIGSSAVLLYAADDPEITSVAMLSPGLSYRGMKTEPAIKALGERPVLLVANRGDKQAARSARRLAKRAKSATLKVFKGSGHGVTMTGPVLPTLVEFIGQSAAKSAP